MNNNRSKQLLASIIGVAILVVAVAGVSFAFFTYSRTGSQNNIITTGKITFVFQDGDFINLTNHFPISTSAGEALTGSNNVCTFTITGNTTSGSTINYAVWAVPGDSASTLSLGADYTTRFQDSEVFVNITSVAGTGTTAFTPAATGPISGLATTASNVGTVPTGGKLLGTGTVTGSGANATRNFTVKMWVDSSVVTVGDAQTDTYTSGEYGHLYYTMKIVVTAQQ